MFSRTAPAAVAMNPAYLAQNDGSELAAGRGSGKQVAPGARERVPAPIPYSQMVYHPMERRLDSAIFRSLFASSAKQARQFVIHGFVRVNGKLVCLAKPIRVLNRGRN